MNMMETYDNFDEIKAQIFAVAESEGAPHHFGGSNSARSVGSACETRETTHMA